MTYQLADFQIHRLVRNFFVTTYVGGVNTDTLEDYCYYSATYLSDAVHTGQVESEGNGIWYGLPFCWRIDCMQTSLPRSAPLSLGLPKTPALLVFARPKHQYYDYSHLYP